PVLFRVISGTRLYQLGLTTYRAGWNALVGLVAWFVCTPVIYALLVLVQVLFITVLHVPTEEHPFSKLGMHQPMLVELVLVAFAAMVVAPVIEELLFRGVLQPWLARRWWGGDCAMALAFFMALLLRSAKLINAIKEQGTLSI